MSSMILPSLRDLFSRPATRDFPAHRRPVAEGYRGSVVFDKTKCNYCGACALRCPTDAIVVDRQAKTLTFDPFRCVACACCAEACKRGCAQMETAGYLPTYGKAEPYRQSAPAPAAEDEPAR
jgi:formate hydrogenlyase subunit 6/NADH:ubiquinone oxidoreductase subunit I